MVIETSRPIAQVANFHEATLGNWGVPRTQEVA
jgi:hypothetical protein